MLLILMMIESIPGTNKYTVRASIKNHAKENNFIWWRWRAEGASMTTQGGSIIFDKMTPIAGC